MSSNSYNDVPEIDRHTDFVTGLSKRIRERRAYLGISQDALGTACGVSRSAVAQWERKDDPTAPTLDKIEPLCDLLDCDAEWLLKGTLPHKKPTNERGGAVIAVDEYDVRVSAGGGFYIDQETKRDVWLFSRQYLVDELRLSTTQLVVLEVIGDSMEPTLRSGDRVLVNRADKRVGQPGVFVLWDGDVTVVKRIEKIPNTKPVKLRTISDNPLHAPYEVLAEDTVIVGRVVWYARRT